MLSVTIEKKGWHVATPPMRLEWVEITDLVEAKAACSKLLDLWWLEITPAEGLGWYLRLDEPIERFIVEVLLLDGELVIGRDTDTQVRITIPEPR